MKPYKERLPLIDAAIEYHKSWPKHNLWSLVKIKDNSRWLYVFTYCTITGGKFICTRDEFNERKRELETKEKDMNDWHSKGELPPVGSVVTFMRDTEYDAGPTTKTWCDGDNVEVISHKMVTGRLLPVCWNERSENATTVVLDCLRPLRTETEFDKTRADILEIIEANGNLSNGILADTLTQQGYRKTKQQTEREFVSQAWQLSIELHDDDCARLYEAGCRFLDKGE